MRTYQYIGPPELMQILREEFRGHAIYSRSDFSAWRVSRTQSELEEPHTFTIDTDITLRLAPRQIEHVVCAGGNVVLSAGEISFSQEGYAPGAWGVREISNQSTGYCPDVDSWQAVALALDKARVPHPRGFTHPFIFRWCTSCEHRNIVKESHFFCAICDAPLPSEWNFDSATERPS
jgi:hypothetical protein